MASERVEVFRKKLVLIAAEAPSLAFEVERKYFTRKARQVMAKQRESESKRKGSKSMVDDEAEEAPAEEEDEHSHQNEEEVYTTFRGERERDRESFCYVLLTKNQICS